MTQLAPQFAPNAAMIQTAIEAALGAKAQRIEVALDEVTLTVAAADYFEVMHILRHDASCQFEQLIDLCGMD